MIRVSVHPKRQRLPLPGEDTGLICASAAQGWRVVEFDAQHLAAHLDRGASIAAVFSDGHARKTSFVESGLIVFDCDDPGEFDTLRDHTWIQQYQRIEGETKRSTPDQVRGRIILVLAEPMRGVDQFADFTDRVLFHLERHGVNLKDRSTTEPHKAFFGFKAGTTRIAAGRLLTLAELDKLPRRPAPAARRSELPRIDESAGDLDQKLTAWIAGEVMPALDRVAPITKGRAYRNCPNPHHADQHASFRVSFEKHAHGYPVCSCNVQYEPRAWSKVAEWVGARSFGEWVKDQQPPKPMKRSNPTHDQRPEESDAPPQPHERAQPDEARRFWAHGVPDGFRTALLKVSDAAALVYEAVTMAATGGAIDPAGWTIQQLKNAAESMGFKLPGDVYRPIEKLVKNGVFCKSITYIDTLSIGDKFAKNLPNKGGAPKMAYSLPSLSDQRAALLALVARILREESHPNEQGDELPPALATFSALMVRTVIEAADEAAEIEAISANLYADPDQQKARRRASAREKTSLAQISRVLRDPQSTPINREWFEAGYREAYTRALREHRADEFFGQGHKTIARAIGVTPQSVRKILKRAGIRDERGSVEAIVISAPSHHVIAEVRRHAIENHAKPFSVRWTSSTGKSEQYPYSLETVRTAADRTERDPGARLEVVYQLPNTQHLITDAQPCEIEAPAPRPAAADRTAEQVQRAADPEPRTLQPVEDTGYTPEWVIGQLKLRFIKRGERLVNPMTGETVRADASPRALIESLIGRKLRTPDPLMCEIASAGGIARVSA